jgi:DNA-binding HxlR family transcriptional regulator
VKHRFDDENCSVARALEIVGDWRTLLIVREAFLGTRRFADFEANLGIAKSVLTQRLTHLTEHGVMARVDAGVHGTRYEYELTAMGKDLATVMTALRQWGDRWVFGEGKEPVLVLDRRTGRALPRVRMLDEEGQPIAARDLEVRPGPGASETTKARMTASSKAAAAARAQAPAVVAAAGKVAVQAKRKKAR